MKTKFKYTLNTSCDSRYFSRAVNLIKSTRMNTQELINFRVWDIGLNSFEIGFLEKNNIEVVKVPKFVMHWKECFTWKVYVLNSIPDNIVLHLDAGNTVQTNIVDLFKIIEETGFFLVDQGVNLSQITPVNYLPNINPDILNRNVFACGNIGFKRSLKINSILNNALSLSIEGFCLGYSINEFHKNKLNLQIRNCEIFRHDQTLINVLFYNSGMNLTLLDHKLYSSRVQNENSYIFNNRNRSYAYIDKKIGLYFMLRILIGDIFYKIEELRHGFFVKTRQFLNRF